MQKRTFLKTTSATVIGSLLSPLISCNTPQEQNTVKQEARKNWAGNLTYSTDELYEPKSIEELQEVVRSLDQVKALGTRHCFNNIADSTVNQVSTEHLNQIVRLDEEARTVTVEAGVSYGQLCPYLHEKGYALHNLASLPHISIAGACATATHGSGVNHGNLPSAVNVIEFVNAEGELIHLSREQDKDKFNGAVVNLGALGIVTRLTLDVQPTFEMRQDVYLSLPVTQLEEHFEAIMSGGYSVSLFTDWKTDQVNQVWIKRKVEDVKGDADAEFYGATLADRDIHPIIEISAENCTAQMGVAGPWYERMPHFRMDFTPSSGTELQAEYFVPRQHAVAAFQAIQALRDQITPLLMISEIRTIAADEFWMSPCYQQSCVAFHFTCEQDWDNLQLLLPKLEEALQPFDVRPHWGKMFTMSSERLASLYPKLPDFRKLVSEYDPKGKFSNAYLQRNIFSEV